ncbi:TonB-dependent receptor [Colwellia sp. 1_MG-2023]|uniref:TonB-dependent receptor n=1 Tax=Colwellia sp. 1_MG-2023 TaxID=3062649 RepID=UPI0026E3414A|nr:TonB-dependent receptor [Colwellia sp. 1_MG-2023]MDO6446730.1 TonB-dependent receptor [Colwellia sp. 1_MG-2023]
MKLDSQIENKNRMALGAHAVAAALAIGSPQLYAAQSTDNCDNNNAVACESKKTNTSDEALERIAVHGVKSSVYLYEASGDIRRVADLVDTPQVITVLTQDQILEAGKTDLKDILAAQAGVTLGTGENGNAFGDRYIIRGHEARSDVFVDGLRDPGMSTRESFATERVEITKGPSSTFAGRGSSGGAVNSVTKKASVAYNLGRVEAGLGTDDFSRITLDYNLPLSDTSAIRINALSSDKDKPGREGISSERTGLQVSGVYLPTSRLSFTLDGYYLDASDVSDLGSYFDSTTRKPVKDIPVYAQESDFLSSEVKTLTLRTEYEVNDYVTLYNATRIGETENGYITTGARGTSRAESDPLAPGAATISLSTHQGNQNVDYKSTQFNLFWDTNVLGFDSNFVFGLEFTDENVDNGVYDIDYNNPTNCVTAGRRGDTNSYCIIDAAGNKVNNISQLMGRTYVDDYDDASMNIETVSAYMMNTVHLNQQLDLYYGLRVDSFDYNNDTLSRGTETTYEYSDTMYNGNIGLIYDLSENVNIYANYSTATNINGGESDLGASCGYGGVCGTASQVPDSDPERVENVELGTKFMAFDDKFMFTASLFQITKSDVMESVGEDDYAALGTLNTGENKVKGIEIGFVGNITDELSVQFSATTMDAEVTDSINENNIGLTLSNFAKDSVYLQVRYELNDSIVIGGDYAYQSEMYAGQPDSAAGYDSANSRYSIVVPDYQVVNLFANYYATDALTFRLNIGNAFDETYYTAAYRSGAFMYLGNANNTKLTATYEF